MLGSKKRFLALATSLMAVLALGACSNNEEGTRLRLEDGDSLFLSTNLEAFSNQDVFGEMITQNGVVTLMDMVDKQVLSGQFELDQEALDERLEMIREQMTATETWESFLLRNGFIDEAALISFLELDQLRMTAVTASITVTEEELRELFESMYPEPAAAEAQEEGEDEDASEAVETDEEVAPARPEFEDVRTELEQDLINSRLTNAVYLTELARLRYAADFSILDPYLRSLYVSFLDQNNIVGEDFINDASETSTTIAARVDGLEVTAEDLFTELSHVAGITVGIGMADPAILREGFSVPRSEVEDVINQQKISLGAQFYPQMAMMGLHGDQAIFDHVELLLLQQAAFDAAYELSDERVQELYDEFAATLIDQISARHILVEDEETAREI
ncbi:MAG: hypothetical protein FWF59_00575, partial [Turicibacter sp.]|nr:hypothetical protein [Turicibacter sp.]